MLILIEQILRGSSKAAHGSLDSHGSPHNE